MLSIVAYLSHGPQEVSSILYNVITKTIIIQLKTQ